MSQSLQSSGRYLSSQPYSPKKEEWGLISQFRALEYEKAKQIERRASLDKQKKFKQQLDNQLSTKSDAKKHQKQLDNYYYQQIIRKDNQLKEKQEKEKKAKLQWFKDLQNQNKRYMDLKNSMAKERHHSSFDIGYASEQSRKHREDKIRKEVIDVLDQQLEMKAKQKRIKHQQQLQRDAENIRYQMKYFQQTGKNTKKYEQNQKVYDYYNQLLKEKKKKQKSMEQKYVDEAKLRRQKQEAAKALSKKEQKQYMNNELKQVLGNQIKTHQVLQQQERRLNPEEHSYSYIGTMFRENPSKNDKKKYYQYLKNQAEEQSHNKRKAKFMTDEEYRLNMNQLDRVLSGNYTHNQYIDRSVTAIGEQKSFSVADLSKKIHSKDSEAVKNKINLLKQESHAKVVERKNE